MLIQANSLQIPLKTESVQCVVTSPPYWGLRDYGLNGNGIGLESTPKEYVSKMVSVFREVRRVLKKDGTAWLNLGDTYAGGGNYRGVHSEDTLTSKQSSNRGARGLSQALGATGKDFGLEPKQLCGIPWLVAFALQADGWWLRQDIIWSKPNPMPESVTDRCTKAHEYLFLLSKNGSKALIWRAADTKEWSYSPDLSETVIGRTGEALPRWRGFDYYYDAEAIAEASVYPEDDRKARSYKTPDGWDTSSGNGGHGSYHKEGREKGQKRYPTDQISGVREGSAVYTHRNRRSVWTISTQAYPEAHFATFPEELVTPCILAGSRIGDTVFDPFVGSGTTVQVAEQLGRNGVGTDLSLPYLSLAQKRIKQSCLKWG